MYKSQSKNTINKARVKEYHIKGLATNCKIKLQKEEFDYKKSLKYVMNLATNNQKKQLTKEAKSQRGKGNRLMRSQIKI